MKLLALASLVSLTACGAFAPKTEEYAKADGPIPVVLTNFGREELCTVTLSPSLTKMPKTETMYIASESYGGHKPALEPGKSMRVSVKAGSYQIHAETCGFSVASEKQMTEFDITGPTAVGFDGEDTNAPPDYQRISLRMQYMGEKAKPDPNNCSPTDTPMPYPADDTKCCSGRIYYNGTDRYHPFCA